MRPRKPEDLVDSRPGDAPKLEACRLRRHRKRQFHDHTHQECGCLAKEGVIIRADQAPLSKSHLPLQLPAGTSRIRSDEMPSDTRSSAMGAGPKLTKTGRVSKARKGVKGAHRCGCGKTYSRAEHLRRHQQNHEKRLPCSVCGKTFHRQDLYDRHLATKHECTYPVSRRDSATSGSLTSSLSAQAPQTPSTFSLPVTTTHLSPVANSRYAGASNYNSDARPSEDPSRYSTTFISPSTPRIVVSSDPTSVNDQSPFLSIIPASRSDGPYIKDEPYVVPFFTDPTFAQLQTTVTEPSPATYLATRTSDPSSGNVSPFSSFSLSSSWAETQSIYAQPHLAEPISFSFNSSSLASPRILSTSVQMPNWLESGTDVAPFTTSSITSPSSSCTPAVAPVSFPQDLTGVPYPLAFVGGQHDKYASLDLERPLEEQQLGIELSLKTKQHYLEAYWTHFDPLFPILHQATYRHASNPLLSAATMAIGAQYTYGPFARADSRILHEKCLELIAKYKNVLSKGRRRDYMQAIFLVEVFSQFKAKRSPSHLSDVFLSMYASLWKCHSDTGRSYFEGLINVQPELNEEELKLRWIEWAAAMTSTKLLTACFVLESIQALALARSFYSTPASGLELLMPPPSALWRARDHKQWIHALQTTPVELVDMAEALERVSAGIPLGLQRDPFQSLALVSCYAASVLSQKQELHAASFVAPAPIHPVFERDNASLFEGLLCSHPHVLALYHLVVLAAHTPMRALLATSGETWILSRRLSQEALLAAAEYTTLQAEMRTWTDTTGSDFFQTHPAHCIQASTHHSLRILQLCCDMSAAQFTFGAEMALYYACLVIWAVTFGASSKASSAGLQLPVRDGANFDILNAPATVQKFCEFAQTDVDRSLHALVDKVIPFERIPEWQSYVTFVLKWAAWRLDGQDASNTPLGELMQNAVGVLGRLATQGLEGEWF